jgi:hypothetical protein
LAALDEHVAGPRTGGALSGRAAGTPELAEPAREAKAKTAERTELLRRLDAAAGAIAALPHGNRAMTGELAPSARAR